jgi:hypothetical protein
MTKKMWKMMNCNMEGQELDLFREKLEDEFNMLLEKGENVSSFLYFPYNFLTKRIKDYLDEFLMLEAFKEIENGNLTPENFMVYQDSLITVKLEKPEQQIEMMDRLLQYFATHEEYEKCAKVQTIMKQINK